MSKRPKASDRAARAWARPTTAQPPHVRRMPYSIKLYCRDCGVMLTPASGDDAIPYKVTQVPLDDDYTPHLRGQWTVTFSIRAPAHCPKCGNRKLVPV